MICLIYFIEFDIIIIALVNDVLFVQVKLKKNSQAKLFEIIYFTTI